jgi:hypothetical protein
MNTKPILAAGLALLLLTLACGTATPTPAPLPPPSDTPAPVPTPTDTPIPDATAPSPLPMTHTGIILNDGECYDLDDGNAPYVLDADCDILKVYPQILRPQNGALLSGYADLTPPSLSDCMGKVFDAGDLAPNTDLYICFLSDEGHYGFIVQRPDGAPFEISSHRLILDWWVYP